MAIYMMREYIPWKLCFTANSANSTIQLTKTWSPITVNLETSTDGNNWTSYTMWTTITLSSAWSKVYFRNTGTGTYFSYNGSNYYRFVMTWSIAASWNITYLCNKNWTDTVGDYCFYTLFYNCSSLTTPPELPATTLWIDCYENMFTWCSNLVALPYLPALTLSNYCYSQMFYNCTNIKLSTTQTWEYQTPYRIPWEWTWTTWSRSLFNMFYGTWWTFTWNPTINTTYYTSNTVI